MWKKFFKNFQKNYQQCIDTYTAIYIFTILKKFLIPVFFQLATSYFPLIMNANYNKYYDILIAISIHPMHGRVCRMGQNFV